MDHMWSFPGVNIITKADFTSSTNEISPPPHQLIH
jgi:hypothetical protein